MERLSKAKVILTVVLLVILSLLVTWAAVSCRKGADSSENKDGGTSFATHSLLNTFSATENHTDPGSGTMPPSESQTDAPINTEAPSGTEGVSGSGSPYPDGTYFPEITEKPTLGDATPDNQEPFTTEPGTSTEAATGTATGKATATPKVTFKPNVTATPKATATPKVIATPKVTATPKPTATPAPTPVTEPDYSKVKTESMPRLTIKTDGGQSITSKDYYVHASITLGNCDKEYAFTDSPAGIRVRGNSTATAPKKPYRIKFDTKQSMLGLNDGKTFKSWCLMADYFDGTMLRTWATFNFAKVLLEDKYYSSDCAPVEVVVNGEYMGVYLLCEQTQIKKNRVNIPEKADGSTDVEIGYLMIGQGGRSDEPETVFVYPDITVYDKNGSSMYFGQMNFSLSGDGYTEAQKEYVSKYTSGVFKVVASALYENKYYTLKRDGTMVPKTSFKGKTTAEKQYETINAVFNIESAVAMCVLDELVKNLDVMTFNMYVDLSPQGDGRLTLAAPWDFDFSMGNTHYGSTHSTAGFYATNLSYSEGMRTNLWYAMLGTAEWFDDMCAELWKKHYDELRVVAWDTLVLSHKYMFSYQQDYTKWGTPANRGTIYHHCAEDLSQVSIHLDSGRFLKEWLIDRIEWLNVQWGNGKPDPDKQSSLLLMDLTKTSNLKYLSGFKRCKGTITSQGLKLTLTEAHDPYFYVDYSSLSQTFNAEDYPYLEITCMIPKGTSDKANGGEFFICSGDYTDATGGVSKVLYYSDNDGQYVTYKVDLLTTGFWNGDIHKIRIDFFNECAPGDTMYIKNISLKAY